jgi:hypothetical protein
VRLKATRNPFLDETMTTAAPAAPKEPKYLAKTFHRGQFLLPMQLAAPKPTKDGAAEKDDAGNKLAAGEVSILARTTEPVKIWGETVVHDFKSLNLPKLTPTDYCHDRNQIIGHADRWALEKEGLVCVASLFAISPGDRAEEILTRLSKGTPYQASIEFEGTLAYYYEGEVEINGQKYSAPLWVWTDWTVLAIAICPLGRDGMTKTELLPTELCQRPEEKPLTQHSVPPAGDAAAVTHEEIKRFHTRFGAQASEYLAKELTYDQAVDAHAAELEKKLAAQATELEEAKKAAATKPKTGLLSRGQVEPISSGTPSGEKAAPVSASPLAAAYANPRFQVPKSSRN